MLKTVSAITIAAVVAGLITLLSSPVSPVDAEPMAKPVVEAMAACKDRPWPYLNCVGTSFGNQRVRVIAIHR